MLCTFDIGLCSNATHLYHDDSVQIHAPLHPYFVLIMCLKWCLWVLAMFMSSSILFCSTCLSFYNMSVYFSGFAQDRRQYRNWPAVETFSRVEKQFKPWGGASTYTCTHMYTHHNPQLTSMYSMSSQLSHCKKGCLMEESRGWAKWRQAEGQKPFIHQVPQEPTESSAEEEQRWWTGRTKWGKGSSIQEMTGTVTFVGMCICV